MAGSSGRLGYWPVGQQSPQAAWVALRPPKPMAQYQGRGGLEAIKAPPRHRTDALPAVRAAEVNGTDRTIRSEFGRNTMSNKGGPRQPSRRNFIRAAAASAS